MVNRLEHHRKESGQTLIVAALVMAVVMGFVALAIDIGLFYQDRREMQNAADAAALAGVQFLPQSPATAIQTARTWAHDNGVTDSEIVKIEVRKTNVSNDTMYVELSRQFSWIFGRVLGQTTSAAPGKAKALVGSVGGNNKMMPWALLQGNSACLDSSGNAIFGATCSVKVGAGSSITGWYGALDYDGKGGGASEYRDNIIDGTTQTKYCIAGDTSPGCVSAVSVVDSLDGNKVGPTGSAIDTRELTAPCDKNSNGKDDFNEIFAANGGAGATYTVICDSPRLIIIPIVSYSSTPVQTVTIRGWSLAYLDTYWCSDGSSSPTPGPSASPTPAPTTSATCNGSGHWEVQVKLVDAVYSQSSGFIAAYNQAGITVRRLIE